MTTCPHVGRCGGCGLLHLDARAQLERKRARLVAALAPYREIAAAVGETRAADPAVRYRTRLKWMAGAGGALGLFARGGHEVVDTPECAVAPALLARVADTLRALLRGGAHPRVAASLRAIDLRAIEGVDGGEAALVTLVLVREERPPRRDLEVLAADLRAAHPEVIGVAANWVAKRSIQVLGPETEIVAGVGAALDRQGDVLVTAAPGGFVQAHRGQAAAMARELVERAAKLARAAAPARALELFAGASPFGLALARAGLDVTAVESFAPAVEGALAAARAQGLALRAIAGDAEAEAERLVAAGERFDLLVVDPPRRGLTPRLRRALAALAPRAVAYVSCDPDTLARDLADLAWRGLAATTITPWDFVPQTEHVEALAWLAPSTPLAPRVLARGAGGVVVVEAPPHLEPGEIARRVGTGSQLAPASILPRGASGVLVLGPPRFGAAASGSFRSPEAPALRGATAVVAVRGAPRARLRGLPGRIDRIASAPGRALLVITLDDHRDLGRLGERLARAGHPVLGDPRDGPTARHIFEKHGVDRPLVHLASLDVAGIGRAEAPLAGDAAAALERLGLAPVGSPPSA